MSFWEIVGVITVALIYCTAILCALYPAYRESIKDLIDCVRQAAAGDDTKEELLPFDPCGSCHRWGECNGVDRPNCPLWRDHDNEEARHGKEKRN